MEILILIGIFAFVVAIIFRSNEALDRVGEVEKEVKAIEEEIGHKDLKHEEAGIVSGEQVTVTQEQPAEIAVSEEAPAQHVELLQVENVPTFVSETAVPIPVEQSTSESDPQPVVQPVQGSESVQSTESNMFPTGDNVRMS